ncbi:MAG TPA: pilus assembly protein [Alphaproteobacteria bacterium]|nr:pilus assembly protein [Alphaproteobacteria bacterium]
MIVKLVKNWIEQEDGVAVMEAAMLMPVMLVLLMGVFDLETELRYRPKRLRHPRLERIWYPEIKR